MVNSFLLVRSDIRPSLVSFLSLLNVNPSPASLGAYPGVGALLDSHAVIKQA